MTRQPPFYRIPQVYSKLSGLAELLLEKDLQRRPKAPQVLAHSWCDGEEESVVHQPTTPLASSHPMATMGITSSMLKDLLPDEDIELDVAAPAAGGINNESMSCPQMQGPSQQARDFGLARPTSGPASPAAGGSNNESMSCPQTQGPSQQGRDFGLARSTSGPAVTAAVAMGGSPTPAAASSKPGCITTGTGWCSPCLPLAGAVRATIGSPASPPRIIEGKHSFGLRATLPGLKHRQEVGGRAVHARTGTGHTVTAPLGTNHTAAAPTASPILSSTAPSNGARAQSTSPPRRVAFAAFTPSVPVPHPHSPKNLARSTSDGLHQPLRGPQRTASDQDLKVRILAGNRGRQASPTPRQVLPVPTLAKRTAEVNTPYDDDHMSIQGPLGAAPRPVFPAPRARSLPREESQEVNHAVPVAKPQPCLACRRQMSAPHLARGTSLGRPEAPTLQTIPSAPVLYRPLEQPRVRIAGVP